MRVLLVAGKGGVGKTTVAAATAAATSRRGRKTLVISTDPAHSLTDALGAAPSAEVSEVDEGLFAYQADPRTLIDESWARLREQLITMLSGAAVDEVVAAEITTLPGVEELLLLAEVQRLASAGQWDAVVVDCAPTAESLRLLALPDAASTYLERLFPAHRRVVRGLLAEIAGGAPGRWDAAADAVGRLVERLDQLRRLLTDGTITSVRLVLTPERVVMAETRRTLTALALQGIAVDGVVANRVVPDPPAHGRDAAAEWMRARRAEQDAVLGELRADLGELDLRTLSHRAAEPIGMPALLDIAAELYRGDDPIAHGGDTTPSLSVEHAGGSGIEAEYRMRVAMPFAADGDVGLSRVDDDLLVTAAGQRRRITLPSVLRRCEITRALADDTGLLVQFRPDPRWWPR